MLSFAALLLFALLAIGALMVDLGLANLSQQLMQNTADAASLEGVRSSNGDDPDYHARQAASGMASQAFNAGNILTTEWRNQGAGPALTTTGGSGGELMANQQLRVFDENGRPAMYRPVLQQNYNPLDPAGSNAAHGDIVSGDYTPLGPVADPADYNRPDFQPGLMANGSRGLLVRMRRTNDFAGLDRIAGVSSSGPPLPYLFGRAATMRKDPAAVYNPREHGITVRGTAIAQAVPARSVGRFANATVRGAIPVVFRLSYWNQLNGGADGLAEDATLSLSGGAIVNPATGTVGYVIDRQVVCAGFPESDWTVVSAAPEGVVEGFIPLYAPVCQTEAVPCGAGDAIERVVGYGYGTITFDGTQITLVRSASSTYSLNTSALPLNPPALSSAEWENLLATSIVAPALAPALVR